MFYEQVGILVEAAVIGVGVENELCVRQLLLENIGVNRQDDDVVDRTVEIATVRASGFSRLSAFIATWVEALSVLGVAIGLVASWLVFNGWQASTIGANNASLSFQLPINGIVMLTAGLLGLAIGIIGGALPAFSATRLPLTAALRARG